MERGFTLLELIVVLVVLGVLATTLYPRVASPYRSGGETACVNNLRQIMAATSMYAMDQSDRMPHPGWGFWGPDNWCYATTLEQGNIPDAAGYRDSLPSTIQGPWQEKGQLFPYMKDRSAVTCPVDWIDSRTTMRAEFRQRTQKLSSYGMNGATMSFGAAPFKNNGLTHKVSMLRSDGILMWAIDETQPFYYSSAGALPKEGASLRHETGYNVGVLDGSAEKLSPNEVGATTGRFGTPQQLPNRFWWDPLNPITGGYR